MGEDTKTRSTISPGDEAVVGVAAPINVAFGVEPEDRAAIQKLVTLTSDPAVEGAWGWLKQDDGRWATGLPHQGLLARRHQGARRGQALRRQVQRHRLRRSDITSDFTIGRNQVVIADVNSHELVVKQDGATVASYPASYGRGEDTGDSNLITRSGTHVVNEFFETKLMRTPATATPTARTLGRPDQQQRRVHPRQPGQRRIAGQLQRHARLRESLAGRCR